MSFLEVEIPDLNLSPPDLHLSLEYGDNVVKLQTPRTEIPHIPPEDAEEKALAEDVAPETLFLSKRMLKDVVDSILKNSILKVSFELNINLLLCPPASGLLST